MRNDFMRYCRQLPVIGFNSGKYDLNLIKGKIAYHLQLHKSVNKNFIVKKNNNYVCLSNDTLKFLDMSNYLPPGTSYDSFLATFQVPVRKSFFPYEYFSSLDVLNDTSLPPKEAFYSTLKRCNVLENDKRIKYEKLIHADQKSTEEALEILGSSEIPQSSIDDKYKQLLEIWDKHNMKTFKDFLQYYSELDVGPFVQGIAAFKKYFLHKKVDVFKDNVSVPGIARRNLYKSGIKTGASFSLIDSHDRDLYDTIKENLTGGPSIIFCRKHVVGETYIRQDPSRPCRSIVGYDANSLYLYAICQEMPVGRYIRRLHDEHFKPRDFARCSYAMYDWMNWLNHSQGTCIQHKLNSGREFRVGPYLIDGYDQNTNILYEFLGDW